MQEHNEETQDQAPPPVSFAIEQQDGMLENTQYRHAPDPIQQPVAPDEAHSAHCRPPISIWMRSIEKLIHAAFFRVFSTF